VVTHIQPAVPTAVAKIYQFESNFINEDRSSYVRTATALNFLAETLHHVGENFSYTDAVYATALNAILVRKGKDFKRECSEKTEAEHHSASV
jgi:hypothetical protein